MFPCFVLFLLLAHNNNVQAHPKTLILSGSPSSKIAHLVKFLDKIPQHLITSEDTWILSSKNAEIFNENGFGTINNLKFADQNYSTIVLTNQQDLEQVIQTQRTLEVLDFDKSSNLPCEVEFHQDYNLFTCQKFVADENLELKNSFFFASAAKNEKKIKKVVKRDSNEDDDDEDDLEEEIQEIVEKKMKEVEKRKKHQEEDNEFDNAHDPKRDHRLGCKYRKSCYETGKLGLIEPYDFSLDHIFHFWRAPASQQHHKLSKEEDADQDGIPDSEDDDISLVERKFVCKYRTSCYKEHNIPLTDKQQERERSFISAKVQVPHGKKRTLKDIANKAIHQVEEREEEVRNRPVTNSEIVEKKLQEIEDKLQAKLDCKYRKSCYETGELPEIDETIPFFFSTSASEDQDDNDENKKPFEEMDDLEKKFYCKYRKSCYETGQLPEIDPEIEIDSIGDILHVADQVETRKLTLQERCKYRKSCYETGILPDLSQDEEQIEKVAHKEVSSVVPSTLSDLKTLCKYRKSCYQEIAVADSSNDAVESIRKRRIIEKEVRKRRTRRHRSLNKRKAMMARYGMRAVYEPVEKTKEELKKIETQREIRKQAPPPKVIKREIKKKEVVKKNKSRVVETAEDVADAVVAQKIAEALAEQDQDDDEVKKVETKKVEAKKPSKKAPVKEDSEESEEEMKPAKKSAGKKGPKVVPVPVPVPVQTKSKSKKEESEEEPAKKIEVKKPEAAKKSPVKKIEDSEEEDEKPEVKKSTSKTPVKKIEDSEEDDEPVKIVPVPVPMGKSKKAQTPAKKIEDSEEEDEKPVVKKSTSKTPVKKIEDSEEGDEPVKKVPKSKKPEPVAKKVHVKETKAQIKELEDDDNEFDNVHDPKRDHRLGCKYRKSCYESGKLGLIEPYDFSLNHILHFWTAPASQQHHNYGRDSDGDGIPDSQDTDTHISHRKLACKYKPSCYRKFDIPVSEEIVEREEKKRNLKSVESKSKKHVKKIEDSEEDDEIVKKSDKKLECKYRKSCYDSGVLPEIQEWNPKPVTPSKISASKHQDEDDDDEEISKSDKKLECKYRKSCYDSGILPTIQQWSEEPHIVESLPSSVKDHKLAKCKYRKSCYEEMGIHEKDEEEAKIVEKEEERKPQLKKQSVGKELKNENKQHQHKKEKKAESSEEDGDNDGDGDSNEKDEDDSDDDVKVVKKVLKEVERQNDVNDMETEIAREIHLSNHEKYICKYRKSCYSTIEPKAAKQDHSGNMARRAGSGEKCHIYYLSCREQMGLPPKEKAPTGPNGKKLCRKVKK
ncbi:unnamed protein product [Caenorhabditis angaria]|uniref:Uncharacterized protein n=1 Tax=Caenorhabditis angaria TaxID=860376 RepID=A0A9P1IGD9_9PELO|nr:unnamed protein product [Caenorhabditis angaria]